MNIRLILFSFLLPLSIPGQVHAQAQAAPEAPAKAGQATEQATEDEVWAACDPVDVAQAMACLDRLLTEEEKQDIADLSEKELFRTHFGLGLLMRNAWMGRGGPLAQLLMKQGLYMPDQMSSLVVDAYWLKLHGCGAIWNDASAVRAAKVRFVAGEACVKP